MGCKAPAVDLSPRTPFYPLADIRGGWRAAPSLLRRRRESAWQVCSSALVLCCALCAACCAPPATAPRLLPLGVLPLPVFPPSAAAGPRWKMAAGVTQLSNIAMTCIAYVITSGTCLKTIASIACGLSVGTG